jgi:hypothetical protein
MNLGDGGRIASIQPEEGVAQDSLSPCGNYSSLLRSMIPIPRKCAASQSLDVQHHREKQKLDHYITPDNHRSYVKGFPKFPELPPEIRMQIFDYAGVAWGANNVYITCRRRYQPFQNTTSACHRAQGLGDSTPGRQLPDYWPYELRASYKLPPLLRTNCEARIAAQKLYKLSFAYQLSHSSGVWFDSTRDKLIMESGGAFDFFKHGAEDTEEDRSERKKVEKTLRYLVIRSLFANEVLELCDYSHGLENLDALYLGEAKRFCPRIQSYVGHCFMMAGGKLRGRWKQAVGKGEITRAPEVYTRHSGDFEKRLGICENEDPEELRFTSMKIKMERINSN